MTYRFVVEDEVLDSFMRRPSRQRERLFRIFQQMADEAPSLAETSHHDSVGRPIFLRRFNGWTIWFWYDSPVKEVRIVEFERTRR
jgi:hypothetical protein